jgi:hypothetical protein
MSRLLLYSDLSRRQLVTSDGGTFSLPPLTLGDTAAFMLRTLDRDANGTLAARDLNIRTLRASIGPVMVTPDGGTFTLRFATGNESATLKPDATTDALRNTVRSLPETTTYPLAEVLPATERGCWLLRFDFNGEVPLRVGTNRLTPRTFVRVRAFQANNQWWHELRLIRSPLVFSGSHERVLPDAPSITRIRAGAPRVEGSTANTNEVQALKVPSDFSGTYYLQFDYRSSRLIGIEDGPDEIASALNAMWTDGKTRFVVTNPEEGRAYIEFTGPLAAAPWPRIGVSVHTFRQGDLTFTLDLKNAELANALRNATAVQLPFEVEAEVVDDGTDPANPAVSGRIVTLFSAPVTIVREQIWEELANVPQIDWLRPPQPRDYIPWTPDQIITGSQHYVAVIGDGTSRSFQLDHMLGTDALHVTVRENTSGGRRLRDDEFSVTFPSGNEAVIAIQQDVEPPVANALAVVITAAGPKSAFQAHHHAIPQVDGLEDALNALGTRIGAIEELLPSVNPAARSGTETGTSLEIEIPDHAEMFPGRLPDGFDVASASSDGKNLPKPAGLLPAIHDATVEPLTVPLPSAAANEGKVFQNNGTSSILIPGGLGRRSSLLEPEGCAGSDGRVWYRLNRCATTNSFYPADFERELFMLHINAQMLRAGTRFTLGFKLALRLFNATTRAQYLLRIDVGGAPGQADPAPTGENIENVTWLDTPLFSQRIILSGLKITHPFGCAIRRDINGALHADQMAYGNWTAAGQAPESASFTLRARLLEFDTENSVRGAKGTVFYALSDASAEIS